MGRETNRNLVQRRRKQAIKKALRRQAKQKKAAGKKSPKARAA